MKWFSPIMMPLTAHQRWWHSAKGRLWQVMNRNNRNAYFRRYYHAHPERRRYLNVKQQEYRHST